MDTSFIGKPHHWEPRRVYSTTGADWQLRVDFERLRKDRLQRVLRVISIAGDPIRGLQHRAGVLAINRFEPASCLGFRVGESSFHAFLLISFVNHETNLRQVD